MQIVINIDKSQIGETIIDTFKSLTTEQKQSIAFSIVEAWFKEPEEIEKKAMEESVINKLRAGSEKDTSSYGYYTSDKKSFSDMTDDEIKKTNKYRELMNAFKSSKTEMIESIRSEMVNFFKVQLKAEIEKDPRVTETKTVALETIREALPEIAAEAMVHNFMSQMYNQQFALFETSMRSNQLTNAIQQISQRLGGVPHVDNTAVMIPQQYPPNGRQY